MTGRNPGVEGSKTPFSTGKRAKSCAKTPLPHDPFALQARKSVNGKYAAA